MNRAPRVAVIQDISGFGRCSMTTALPVLAVMGNQCCPIPTAYLSAHTGFSAAEHLLFQDTKQALPRTAEHWKKLGVELDAIYSGFLSSAEQADDLFKFTRQFQREGGLTLVDPVLGDHGTAYRTCTPELCARMSELAAHADVITPNQTEAALLLGEPYQEKLDQLTVRLWLERLSLDGKRSVVLTGISAASGELGAACMERGSTRVSFPMARQEKGHFPGTGDLFASVLLGGLLRGEDLHTAAATAVNFVQKCVHRTLMLETPVLEGVQFEGLLSELAR